MNAVEHIEDAEVVEPGTEIERVPSAGALFKTDDPAEIMQRTAEIASSLKEFVKAQGLTSVIGGRDYLLVEAWQMLGMMLGVTPGKVSTRSVENGWEATVDLHDRSGRVVGSGSAECLDTEKTWKSRDDYARKSMAQTRAVGKAFRNTFGFIAKAAGYEATPAEEMPPQATGRPFGDPATVEQMGQATRAAAYALGLEITDPRVGHLIEAVCKHGDYYPAVATRCIGLLAKTLKELRAERDAARKAQGETPAVGDPAGETAEEKADRERAEGIADEEGAGGVHHE